jgi:hypothetical protein
VRANRRRLWDVLRHKPALLFGFPVGTLIWETHDGQPESVGDTLGPKIRAQLEPITMKGV